MRQNLEIVFLEVLSVLGQEDHDRLLGLIRK